MTKETLRQFDQDSLGRRLSTLSRLNMLHLGGRLAELEISPAKLPFLMKILASEGIVQEELTNHLRIDRAATARALQHLERQGLVRREDDPSDGRKKRVYPTDKAQRLQPRIIDILANHNAILLAGFDAGEREQFTRLLEKALSNIEQTLAG
jgi:DNA-binding MarR family transcriptional regulator